MKFKLGMWKVRIRVQHVLFFSTSEDFQSFDFFLGASPDEYGGGGRVSVWGQMFYTILDPWCLGICTDPSFHMGGKSAEETYVCIFSHKLERKQFSTIGTTLGFQGGRASPISHPQGAPVPN